MSTNLGKLFKQSEYQLLHEVPNDVQVLSEFTFLRLQILRRHGNLLEVLQKTFTNGPVASGALVNMNQFFLLAWGIG
jgi:hypothetical protein